MLSNINKTQYYSTQYLLHILFLWLPFRFLRSECINLLWRPGPLAPLVNLWSSFLQIPDTTYDSMVIQTLKFTVWMTSMGHILHAKYKMCFIQTMKLKIWMTYNMKHILNVKYKMCFIQTMKPKIWMTYIRHILNVKYKMCFIQTIKLTKWLTLTKWDIILFLIY